MSPKGAGVGFGLDRFVEVWRRLRHGAGATAKDGREPASSVGSRGEAGIAGAGTGREVAREQRLA